MTEPQRMTPRISTNWLGLGHWNYYFLLKFGLLWAGYLNFHPLANLSFAAVLLIPLASPRWRQIRQWLALPVGLALFHYDTWLPGIRSLLSQGSQITGFSTDYLIELASRFINWNMLGAMLVLWVGYRFLAQWIRISVLVMIGLLWINLGPALALSTTAPSHPEPATARAAPAPASITPATATNGPASNQELEKYLAAFYNSEKQRHTAFPSSLPADAQPFDILIINICSLSWDDLKVTGQLQHPLWQHFDVLFKQFNSATAYSGPASLRLLRASCGQPSHKDLYQVAERKCYLFDNLAKLGFDTELMLDHSGEYGHYLSELRTYGDMQKPLLSQQGITAELTSFDNAPIYDDAQLLTRWLHDLPAQSQAKTATFFNLIPLHDGNRLLGQNKGAPYDLRAKSLFDKLDTFLSQLEKSGRKVMVVVVPEHGAALAGDKMQMSGLRDIPSVPVTQVPVGIKFVNMQAPAPKPMISIDTPVSHLAVSELISRVVDGKLFTSPQVDWAALTQDLPQTPVVSENDNAIVMTYQGENYIRLNGSDWVPYPH